MRIPLQSHIDHLVVAATTLDQGVEYIERTLGVVMQPGGKHSEMGTHNYLLKLGDTAYLEVIAIDPEAPVPGRPRWFGLDHPEKYTKPILVTWIAATTDIYCAAKASTINHGKIDPMRRGDFDWLITINEDGTMPCDGIAPMLIEWKHNLHPCDRLDDKGCKLLQLELFHPAAKTIHAALPGIGFKGPLIINESEQRAHAGLVAHIQTANGIIALC